MLKQIRRILPFITLKLPGLPRRKYCYQPIPIIGLELIGCVHENEAEGPSAVDAGEETGDVQDIGRDGGGVRRRVGTAVEEGFYICHA